MLYKYTCNLIMHYYLENLIQQYPCLNWSKFLFQHTFYICSLPTKETFKHQQDFFMIHTLSSSHLVISNLCCSIDFPKKKQSLYTYVINSTHSVFMILPSTITYTVQANDQNTASKAKKPSHGSHSVSVNCNKTSVNYSDTFAYFHITNNTFRARPNPPEKPWAVLVAWIMYIACN